MTRPDVEVMRDLLAKVKAATGPDRGIDADLQRTFGPPIPTEYWTESDTTPIENLSYVIRFTAGIDAAVALIERVFPEATWAVAGPSDHSGRNRASVTAASPFRPMPVIAKGCATPGLNLVAALLTALIPAEDRHG